MELRNTSTQYGSLAIALHWLVAIGLFALIYLGLEQADMDKGDARSRIRFLHASIASITFMLMTIRLVWRFMNEVPASPEAKPAWQSMTAALVHWGLYITVFVQIFAGAMVVGTGGKGVPVFNLFTIPLPIAVNEGAHEWWEEVHEIAWIPLAAMMIVHILAALYDHFVVKNDTLRRITVGVK